MKFTEDDTVVTEQQEKIEVENIEVKVKEQQPIIDSIPVIEK